MPVVLASLLDEPDQAGDEPLNVRREAGRCEEKPEQDAHRCVQDTQPGIPARDKTATASTASIDIVTANESPHFQVACQGPAAWS
jgi:hypothetical protein